MNKIKKLILTGERGAGKSTLCDALVREYGKRTAGLKTLFKEDRKSPHSFLYACGWGEEAVFDEAHIIARFGGGRPEALTGVFDTYCAGLIDRAVDSRSCELIVIDELGFLEKEALKFKSAVLRALDCPKPLIAVVRQGLPGWTGEAAERGSLFEVREENRDRLFLMLKAELLNSRG